MPRSLTSTSGHQRSRSYERPRRKIVTRGPADCQCCNWYPVTDNPRRERLLPTRADRRFDRSGYADPGLIEIADDRDVSHVLAIVRTDSVHRYQSRTRRSYISPDEDWSRSPQPTYRPVRRTVQGNPGGRYSGNRYNYNSPRILTVSPSDVYRDYGYHDSSDESDDEYTHNILTVSPSSFEKGGIYSRGGNRAQVRYVYR